MIPRSQDGKPISFLLFDDVDYIEGRDLIIRPEELTRTEPFRNSIQQTLGGAWLDDFGMGIQTINISGHTGWHGSAEQDGVEQFLKLRDLLVNRWKAERDKKALSGNPDDIKMVFADQLDQVVVYVSPQTFQLRRHRTRPLLMQYNIAMSVMGPLDEFQAANATGVQDAIVQAINNPRRWQVTSAALDQVSQEQAALDGLLAGSGLAPSMVQAARALMVTTGNMLSTVRAAANSASGVIDSSLAPLMVSTSMILEASRNAYQILATPSDILDYAKNILQGCASNMEDALCNIKNGFRRLFTIPDWSDMFGSSTCSSTGGGSPASPLAFQNPFYQIIPATGSAVHISSDAFASANRLRADPLNNTLSQQQVVGSMNLIHAGVKIT